MTPNLSIAELERILKMAAASLERSTPQPSPITRAERNGRLPLSFAQQRLWFLDQMGSVGSAYHIPARLRLQGTLDRDALVGALDRVVARHEALRTTFVEVDGTPLQRISPAEGSRFHLIEHDLSGHPDPEAELRQVMTQEGGACFDLVHGPLIRGRLIRLAEDDHVLLVTMHHIVSDGWSMGVLVNELSALYGAFHRGEPDPLPLLPVQYPDYAVWQRRSVAGEVLQQQAEFWKRTLAGAPELLELPTDHPRPAQQDHAGAAIRVELDEALVARLKALGARHETTLFMTLLAGWVVVLSRLSGQEDVVIGTPSANRGRAEIEGLIGFFVNTLALRVDLSGSPSVAELLGTVKARSLAAQQHQDIPFEQVVEAVQPVRSLSHSPLFQAMFAWQNTAAESLQLPGLRTAPVGAALQTTAKVDLSLTLRDAGGRIAGGVEYATALFERATVERYLGYLRRVLEAMVEDERQAVDRLPLLAAAERRQVVEGWNVTEAEYPGRTCVHALFEAQVERTPDAVAVVDEDRSLTYAELNARANRLAHHLRALGAGPGARVAILVPRSIELVVSELAILKAGAAYVPIDPSFPAERIAFMVADSGAPLVLSRTHADLSMLAGVERVDVDALPEGACHDPRVPLHSGAEAYVMYTSGSTGEPKGVMVPHRAIARLVFNNGYADFRADDRVAFAANPAFDATTMEVWGPLLHGGRTVVIPPDVLLDSDAFGRTLADQQITTLFITTAVFNQYAQAIPGALSNLRHLLTGGEAADPSSFARVLAENGPVSLVHCYGPTETTTFAITDEVTDVEEGARSIPLGRPIANTRVYVLDAHGEPVPVGVGGELYIGGAGVALGYQKRPGLTAERFVPDPFGGEPGARLYRTGDLGRWLPDGTIEFLGRNDHQVKVRGFRIELGEIEARLLAHPEVREAVVLAREDAPGDKRLVAYYVGAEGADAETLHAHLSKRLPGYMVPAAYVRLEALPLTPNGKVDRRALPAPDGVPARERYTAPRTPVEEVLAEIWAEVLRLERVGVEDGFFERGGHSLLAMRVVSRVREVFGVELPVRTIFEGPTVAQVARWVEEARRAELPLLPPVVPVERIAPLPLSFAQERLWLVDQMEGAGALYNVPVARRLAGALDVEALRGALAEIVRRHEALRTVFREVEGSLQQVIVPFAGFEVPLEDISGLDESEREAEAGRRAAQDAARPFDLAAGPLIRARLLRLGEEEHVLLLCVHHVASDGWSMGVLFHELNVLYGAFREKRGSPLPEMAVQYADYAVWQRRHLGGDALEPHLAYWRETLSGAPELLALPADYPRPAARTHRGGHEGIEFPAVLLERLRALGRGEGATLFMVLLGAFQALLSRYGGGEDVVVGSPIAGRTSRELEGLIGYFANTLVLRTDLGGDPAFRDVLRRVRAATLGAYEHEDVPFDRLVAELRPERSPSHSPLFQVTFTLQDGEPSPWSLPDLRVSPVETEARFAKFDLMLAMQATPHGLRGGLSYATDLFERGTIRRMLGHLERVLEQVAEDADVRLSGLKLAGEAERARLVEEWSLDGAEFRVDRCIHERFEARALERPDAPALTFEAATLTYRELNERANRLAHRLRALGVGPETRVGIALERSAELVAAILAVLKAGGAYVPLDPAYPAERIAFVLEDAEIPVLVTASHLVPQLPAFSGAALCVDTDADAIARESGENPGVEAGPNTLAYVIYTSGSTGKPKGVQVTHANVARLFDATDAWFGFAADDVWTLFHSCAFDFSVWEIWGALLYGGRLVVVPFLTSRSPEDFHRLLVDEGVTMLSQTPSAFKQLVQADLASGVDPSALRLRCVVFGGEALDPQSLRPWMERHGERPRLVNMYGITETTVHVTYRVITRADLDRAGSPIGVPIPDLSLYVLDAGLEPVPAGVTGELFVGGAGVARGYLNRPELTAERFIRDPFSADPAARLYRTGDLARRRADGELEYLGRADQQVKIRGFRIETGEIEAALASHPAVAACAVVAREDAAGERRLVAYVVAPPGAAEPTPAELRAHLAQTLPEHMVPGAFVPLDALPLTENGKLDRRALPAPEETLAAMSADAYVPPGTAAETELAHVWREVLGVERVGIDDNYFALGGDSIRSVRLVAAARRRGLSLSIPHIYRHQTVRALAAAADLADPLPGSPEPRAAPFALLDPAARAGLPDDVEDAYPVSQVQLGMLYHTARDPDSLVYHEVLSSHVRTRFDESAMREALRRIADRHPILRTSFDLAATPDPIQRVHRQVEIPLEITDARALDPDARDAWMEREKAHGFDWTRAPLVRFHVVILSEDSFRLVFVEHHAVLDGWSVASLMTELVRVYVALRDGREDPTGAAPAARFRDFVALEREAIASEESRAFWRRVMDGAPVVALPPVERENEPGQDDASYLWIDLPDGIEAELRRAAERAGVPLKTVVLAAYMRVLGMLGGTDEVVTGYVTSGRPETEDGERVLGIFLNTVPLRMNIAGCTWGELVQRTWTAEEALLEHRRFPLSEIVRYAGGQTPFEVGFNFTHFHVYDALAGSGVQVKGDRSFEKTEVPLLANVTVSPSTGGLRLRLDYHPARLGEGQVRRIAGWYARALAALAERPDDRCDADGLMEAEDHARLRLLGTGRVGEPDTRPVSLRFAAQASRTPDAAAVACGGGSITYRELDQRANRLARLLARRGAGPDALVGVHLERGPELVVSLLAVLKAGAAYLPLDPGQPAARLAAMLEDSGARLLVTAAPLLPEFAGWDGEVVALDREAERIAAERPDTPDVHPDPDTLAYVLYTSGSTGEPKGVGVPHRALASQIAWMLRAFPLTPGDRLLQKTPIGFDASVWEFWAPLLAGATLVMAPPGAHRDAGELLEAVRRERITVLQLVPSVLRVVVDHPALTECRTLRRLFCGGEALPAELAARARARTGAEVVNLYGPTEVCIQSVVHVFAGEGATSVPIGRPVDNVRAHVLSAAGTPVPPGAPGELYLGGVQLARGYPGRPGLTADRFVPDPFSALPGERLYRTGDRVRWLPEGVLEFLGRADGQVKVRGFRVETGEVEAVLRRHPDVADAVVQARDDAGGETRLVAYVVAAPGAEAAPAVLGAHLRSHLPDAMVPSAFVALDALPLTPNGKLDLRALPAPDSTRGEGAYIAPRDALELRLARLFEEVLGTEAVGVRDDFFHAGGHSLAALRLLAAVERLTGRRVPVATLVGAPTVELLAEALRSGADFPAPDPLVPLQTAGAGRPLFLVHAAGGNVVSYAALARHLGAGQPVYALQSRGLEGEDAPRTCVREMAAAYLERVRAVQPAGPYRLGGWSMGGLVAFEMARQLEAAGEAVELVAVIDSRAPGGPSGSVDSDDAVLLASFLRHLGVAPEAAMVPEENAAPDARLRWAWEAARMAELVPREMELARFGSLWSVFRANVAAAAAHRPEPCAAELVVVAAEDRPGAADDAAAWTALTTGTARSLALPGDHFSLVREPHVRAVAEVLAGALAPGRDAGR